MITLTVAYSKLDMLLNCEMTKNYTALQKCISCIAGHHLNCQCANSVIIISAETRNNTNGKMIKFRKRA